MRAIGFVISFLLLSVVAEPLAAAPCVPGDNVNLAGEIIIAPIVEGDEWFWPGDFAKPCEVRTITGTGKLPAECVVGKRLELRGRVIEDGVLILKSESIRCF